MSIPARHPEPNRAIPVRYHPVSRRDGKPGLATFVHCIAASTSLPSAQNDPELGLLR